MKCSVHNLKLHRQFIFINTYCAVICCHPKAHEVLYAVSIPELSQKLDVSSIHCPHYWGYNSEPGDMVSTFMITQSRGDKILIIYILSNHIYLVITGIFERNKSYRLLCLWNSLLIMHVFLFLPLLPTVLCFVSFFSEF